MLLYLSFSLSSFSSSSTLSSIIMIIVNIAIVLYSWGKLVDNGRGRGWGLLWLIEAFIESTQLDVFYILLIYCRVQSFTHYFANVKKKMIKQISDKMLFLISDKIPRGSEWGSQILGTPYQSCNAIGSENTR